MRGPTTLVLMMVLKRTIEWCSSQGCRDAGRFSAQVWEGSDIRCA